MASSDDDQGRQRCCFQEWINLQEQDLSELVHGLTLNPDGPGNRLALSQLADKNVQHFQDYISKRRNLASDDVSAFFAPTWCTSLENSLLWIAGCRPSMFIRLVYAICGSAVESKLTEFLQGLRIGNLSELSARQLSLVNELHGKTIREEEKLSSRIASLQEDIADQPLVVMAKEASRIGELNRDTDKALDDHSQCMASVLDEADRLRLSTLKELMDIFTPIQAVDFLAASKKLYLCMHEWGRKRDNLHGRNAE